MAPSTPLVPSSTNSVLHTHCSYIIPTLTHIATSNPNLQLLDIGCGSGHLTTELALFLLSAPPQMLPILRSPRVTGLDISSAVLESAKLYSQAHALTTEQVRFQAGSALALPFPNNSFDVVHAHQVLSYVSDAVTAVREMVRVVRKDPRGCIFLREGDLTSARIEPEGRVREVLGEFYRVLAEVLVRDGAVADGAQRMRGWLEMAGIDDAARIRAGTSRYDTRERRREYAGFWPARCMGGMFAEKAMELGVRRFVDGVEIQGTKSIITVADLLIETEKNSKNLP